MRRTKQRGSTVEIIPVVFIGIVVAFGAVQVTLFMSGKHAADLAAYRASRVLEQRGRNPAEAMEAARREATTVCSIGYPGSLSSVQVQSNPAQARAQVQLRMEPLLPLPVLSGPTGGSAKKVVAQHPPAMEGH